MVYYLELGDYCQIAAEVLGLKPERVAELPNIGLADSALAVPRAGFGDHEAFPTLIEKAAVLVERLANDLPILDADPDTDVPMMERIAAGEASRDEIAAWVEQRSAPAG